jgi:peroxiredoxin
LPIAFRFPGQKWKELHLEKLTMSSKASLAPEWRVQKWFNTKKPIQLSDLRGKVVVLHTFQMLCPGCVMYGLPQAQKIYNMFPKKDVAVIGLHTVFEHHDAYCTRGIHSRVPL